MGNTFRHHDLLKGDARCLGQLHYLWTRKLISSLITFANPNPSPSYASTMASAERPPINGSVVIMRRVLLACKTTRASHSLARFRLPLTSSKLCSMPVVATPLGALRNS